VTPVWDTVEDSIMSDIRRKSYKSVRSFKQELDSRYYKGIMDF